MRNPQKTKQNLKQMRQKRTRAKIKGTVSRPRLSVFRSHKHIYAQLIDDENGRTLVSASDFDLKSKDKELKIKIDNKEADSSKRKLNKKEAVAYQIGHLIAVKALKKKTERVVFDRGGYKYHGRVAALAEGARAGGLKF